MDQPTSNLESSSCAALELQRGETSRRPLCIDLYCGLGGWAEGFLSEGYDVIGFDIERHRYPIYEASAASRNIVGWHEYPGHLVLQDVTTLHGSQLKDAAVIVASPPCTEYSYMAMPWKRAKQIARALRGKDDFPKDYKGSRTIAELNTLFYTCFRLQREASAAAGRYIPLVVENVKGAQPWVGRARWHYGSFYLWGDVPALMPITLQRAVMKEGVAHRSNGETNGRKLPEGHDTFAKSGKPCNKLTDPRYGSEGSKVPGMNWSYHGEPGYKAKGFNVTAAQRYRELEEFAKTRYPELLEEGVKQHGSGPEWFDNGIAKHSSKSDSRKAASAQIAKIPFPLARHIADVYRPVSERERVKTATSERP